MAWLIRLVWEWAKCPIHEMGTAEDVFKALERVAQVDSMGSGCTIAVLLQIAARRLKASLNPCLASEAGRGSGGF